MNRAMIDRKPSRLLRIHVPLALGLITGLLIEPMCICPWPELLLIKGITAVAGAVFWWIVIMAGFHSYRFLRNLFHRPQ